MNCCPLHHTHSDHNPLSYLQSNRSATFCVEIKPKQGWKFNGSPKDEQQFQRLFQLPDRSMLSKCRYCVMQHLKVSECGSCVWIR